MQGDCERNYPLLPLQGDCRTKELSIVILQDDWDIKRLVSCYPYRAILGCFPYWMIVAFVIMTMHHMAVCEVTTKRKRSEWSETRRRDSNIVLFIVRSISVCLSSTKSSMSSKKQNNACIVMIRRLWAHRCIVLATISVVGPQPRVAK